VGEDIAGDCKLGGFDVGQHCSILARLREWRRESRKRVLLIAAAILGA
jgi:hypothetical protein